MAPSRIRHPNLGLEITLQELFHGCARNPLPKFWGLTHKGPLYAGLCTPNTPVGPTKVWFLAKR
jgi:hypothetical protein